eukprot:6492754-Amphidinium_carterae.4
MVGTSMKRSIVGSADAGGASSRASSAKAAAKKKFKMDFGGGPKVCDLCKASSKDVERESLLVSEDMAGNRLPQGSKCKKCYTVWQTGFPQHNWEDLLEADEKDEKLKKMLDHAFLVYTGNEERSWQSEEVTTNTWLGLEIKREVLVFNERELKRVAGTEKLSKKAMKSVPNLEVMKEDGSGVETVWVFKDESQPYRRGTLKMMTGCCLKQWHMESEQALYPSQGLSTFPHFTGELAGVLGTKDILDKDFRGNLNLSTVDEFLTEKVWSEEIVESPSDALAMADAVKEADVKLVGAAAAALQDSGTTPDTVRKRGTSAPSCLPRRLFSSTSLASGEANEFLDESSAADGGASQGATTGIEGSVTEAEYTGQLQTSHKILPPPPSAAQKHRQWLC